ncbi:Hsp20/alpha crystallin family protein [Neobacillus sp. SM06]|uniref:Hsp20/alpha crystallin family protein n=1 Tax=Neobacillus sp. SM06 TaxID=3422492 RepID=UPI003D2A752C
MDHDQFKQWLEIAQNMNGNDFWHNIFDKEFAQQFINEKPLQENQQQASPQHEKAGTFPLIDIIEGKQKVIILVELPGVKRENVELGLKENVLVVKGKVESLHPNLTLIHSERFHGEFQREIPLPDKLHSRDLHAQFWKGILFVSYKRQLEKKSDIPIE